MKFRGLEKAEVFIVTVCEGDGTEDNPYREIKYYMIEGSHGRYKELYIEDSFKGSEE